MKAAVYETFGPARDVLHLQEIDLGAPAAGEVRVAVQYSGVNPSDVKARAGSRPGVTKPPFPQVIPHSDGTGVIEAVGEGVDPARVGEKVWLWNGQWQRPFGTCAEAIVLPQEQAVALPEGVSMETGAVLGIPGLTAAQCVFGAGDVAGKSVLVSGGAGMVGRLAVQLAKWGGANVIATGSPRDFDEIRASGASAVVDYREENLGAALLDANKGQEFDLAVELEFGENIHMLTEVMAPLSQISIYGSAKNMTPEIPFGPMLFKALKMDITLIYLLPLSERLKVIAHLHKALEEGAINSPVAEVFKLADAAAAHEAVETATRRGAILVEM